MGLITLIIHVTHACIKCAQFSHVYVLAEYLRLVIKPCEWWPLLGSVEYYWDKVECLCLSQQIYQIFRCHCSSRTSYCMYGRYIIHIVYTNIIYIHSCVWSSALSHVAMLKSYYRQKDWFHASSLHIECLIQCMWLMASGTRDHPVVRWP